MTAVPRAALTPPVSDVRERIGRSLLWLAGLGAAVSAVLAASTVLAADDATKVIEIWRMYGLAVFAGLFVLLARRPRRYRGVWELVIVNKLALTLTGLLLLGNGARDADSLVVGDGLLSLVLITAYICCRGWTAGPQLRGPAY